MSLIMTQNQNVAQNDLAAQAQYTDRYTKSVDQLGQQGADRLQIRLGGIYALERLAHDSPRDQPTIIEILAAFIRGTRTLVPADLDPPSADARPTNNPSPGTAPCQQQDLTADARAALTVLGRRDTSRDNATVVDLRQTCFAGVNLGHMKLESIDFAGSDFVGAHLFFADLHHVDLQYAHLAGADFHGALLTEAQLSSADLQGTNLAGADLTSVGFQSAHLQGAKLMVASLDHANFDHSDLREAQLGAAFLRGAQLTFAQLIHANLDGATLTDANLLSSDLASANLNGANLTGSDLTSANLTGAQHNPGTVIRNVHTEQTKGAWW
ncbi:pentapeptide repeat-containing protein [Amycolatopsis sp. NPDC004625]|uniref:pentapeptide repeat-containing protein n=1 Tax=Amycolatopsis sp. NPDC004625 TaxID=3154670 RepID=UPI0033A21113